MSLNRRIFVSAPRDIRLDRERIQIKDAIIEKIVALGYEPQIFLDRYRGSGLAAGLGWSLENVDKVVKRCVGAVLIGVPFTATTDSGEDRRWLPSDYCQYEGGVARAYGLPTLAIAFGIKQRILFHDHEPNVVSIPPQGEFNIESDEFGRPFEEWVSQVEQRRDVFFGFCGKSAETAESVMEYLRDDLSVSVLDWRDDFLKASTILEQIERAASLCSAGIFLFTRDDSNRGEEGSEIAVPRDNVVFETGFFCHAKGNERVLIIQEEGAKTPTDLGGKILLLLPDRNKIDPIKDGIQQFINTI